MAKSTKKKAAAPDTKKAAPVVTKDATQNSEPFTDVHERCAIFDKIKKIVDVVGNIIEDIPQAWRHGKSVTTEKTD